MPEKSSIPKFHDAGSRPPVPGGWHYYLDPQTRRNYIKGSSEDEVHAQVKRYRKNNGTFTDDHSLWAELWKYWCALNPQRCSSALVVNDTEPMVPGDPSPKKWGPWIWNFLSWSAVNFDRVFFMDLINQMPRLLVCPNCQAEFSQVMLQHPPFSISTALEACQWVNTVHNEINKRLGKPVFSYNSMIREYGAPIPPYTPTTQ